MPCGGMLRQYLVGICKQLPQDVLGLNPGLSTYLGYKITLVKSPWPSCPLMAAAFLSSKGSEHMGLDCL